MKRLAWLMIVVCGVLLLGTTSGASASRSGIHGIAQASVTGTPEGPSIIVPDEVNVRLGPGTEYDKVGVLIAGQRAPALGRSAGGLWIQIAYPGVPGGVAWVYSHAVVLESNVALKVVEPPPTSTPRVTSTIDPTLAAQFNLGEAPPTRLPTFTPVEPVIRSTFEPIQAQGSRGVPPILAILGLLVVGFFGLLISFLRGG